MKPEQFIREKGLKKARHVLSGLPNYYTHMTDDARMFISEHNKELDENIRKQLPSLIRLEDLKRLVESVELINLFGSIKIAKDKVQMADFNGFLLVSVPIENGLADVYIHKVEQAIRDHESIYGGGENA
ncbi:TPA: hypothetical protein LUC71_002566 [Acinetobacter baumannii]|uniref:hypothetical protein n=1 Tax=Acinetobacter baumannii TaxID=470 RepID=UPI0013CA6C7E|nr:hypothetical protein [Acinetobacter baumannii]NDW25407.1 hypothetical protein [Acinetobacter baumannii]HBM1135824.1 hypothetical protein [Acinetobacter baumannii]